MNDKDRTNYLRQKLVDMKSNPAGFSPESETAKPEEVKAEKRIPPLNRFFQLVFTYFSFYGAQYIILSKYVSSELTLNFFEAGVIFLCMTSLIGRRS